MTDDHKNTIEFNFFTKKKIDIKRNGTSDFFFWHSTSPLNAKRSTKPVKAIIWREIPFAILLRLLGSVTGPNARSRIQRQQCTYSAGRSTREAGCGNTGTRQVSHKSLVCWAKYSVAQSLDWFSQNMRNTLANLSFLTLTTVTVNIR